MRVRKTKKVIKEVDEVIEDYICCDKCGKDTDVSLYNAFDFKLEMKTGTTHCEGGSGKKYELDLCENCAKEIVCFLQENGYNVQETEWDY